MWSTSFTMFANLIHFFNGWYKCYYLNRPYWSKIYINISDHDQVFSNQYFEFETLLRGTLQGKMTFLRWEYTSKRYIFALTILFQTPLWGKQTGSVPSFLRCPSYSAHISISYIFLVLRYLLISYCIVLYLSSSVS